MKLDKKKIAGAMIATVVGVALSGFSATTIAGQDHTMMGHSKGKIKCFGVSRKGRNDCGTSRHSCAGKSKRNFSHNDWVLMTKKQCAEAKMRLHRTKKAIRHHQMHQQQGSTSQMDQNQNQNQQNQGQESQS